MLSIGPWKKKVQYIVPFSVHLPFFDPKLFLEAPSKDVVIFPTTKQCKYSTQKKTLQITKPLIPVEWLPFNDHCSSPTSRPKLRFSKWHTVSHWSDIKVQRASAEETTALIISSKDVDPWNKKKKSSIHVLFIFLVKMGKWWFHLKTDASNYSKLG